MKTTTRRIMVLGLIMLIGIVSRRVSTGFVIFDNYLGDALYAALVFMLILVVAPTFDRSKAAISALGIVVLIEVFQLTDIPLQMRSHDSIVIRLLAVVLGTTFNGWDIVSYALGILVFFGYEYSRDQIVSSKPMV